MKKISFFVLIFVSIFLVGCGAVTTIKQTDSPTINKSTTTTVEKVYHTASYYDEKGQKLKDEKVAEGEVPSYTYSKEDTKEWDYTVLGWSTVKDGTVLSSLPPITSDVSYYAIVQEKKMQYTITFEVFGGSIVSSIKMDYGSSISAPDSPTKEGYSFVVWCTSEELSTVVEWPYTLAGDVTFYASYNEKTDVSKYLEALLKGYELNPYSYIPETMQEGSTANLVNAGTIITDYTKESISTSKIRGNGFGEQWHMILENLDQSKAFFNVLSVIEGLTTSSITAFNNYLDSNPADTSSYSFKTGVYSVTIKFKDNKIYYVLDYTASIGSLGEQSIQIALSMDISTNEKEVRIEAGEANALKYNITNNSYTFAIMYLGVRKAEFTIVKNADSSIEGHINEFLTVSGKGISSAADFYIGSDYVTVVGNKAGGIIGFSGYISELYSAKTGKLLSYEVRETLSSVTYNTLWFDLSYVSGIDSLKYVEATEVGKNGTYYLNESDTVFQVKKVGGLSLKTLSRRYDIEMRDQYFYTYNSETKSYDEVKASVPMLFIQEEYFDSFSSDVLSVNSTLNLSITLPKTDLTKVESDYDSFVDVFIKNKEKVTEEIIVSYIGTKVTFTA